MRLRVAICCLLLATFACSYLAAAPVRIKTSYQSGGAGVPDVLVIVKSLEGKGEIFRALTDSRGIVAERDLSPGLYRVIATCPFGICKTKLSEFVVRDAPLTIELTLDSWPTRDNVGIIGDRDRIVVEISGFRGQPLPSAEIMVRDAAGQNEAWYRASARGEIEVEIPPGDVTVGILPDSTISETTFTQAEISKLQAQRKKLQVHY